MDCCKQFLCIMSQLVNCSTTVLMPALCITSLGDVYKLPHMEYLRLLLSVTNFQRKNALPIAHHQQPLFCVHCRTNVPPLPLQPCNALAYSFPSHFPISSPYRANGLPLFLAPSLGIHSVTLITNQ